MLWGIDPLLDADLLYALRRMGHGDEIAVVDTNYPAVSTAMSTTTGAPLLMAGVSAARAVEAILSVMPLDTFVPDPAGRMEVVGDPDAIPPVQREVQAVLDRAAGKHVPCKASSASTSTSAPKTPSSSSSPANAASTATSFSRKASCRRSEAPALPFGEGRCEGCAPPESKPILSSQKLNFLL